MSDVRSPLHQPPNPDDLRRQPPAGPECATARGWMRDAADGDLTPACQRLLDEHVHVCRVCAVELARAEHEVQRVRRAYAAPVDVPTLPRDFAKNVVRRLVLDETSLVPAPELAAARAAAAAASVDVAPVRRRLFAVSPVFAVSPGVAVLACLLCLLLIGIGLRHYASEELAPERSARLVVVDAASAFGDSGRAVGIGDGLGDRQSLWITGDGSARLEWHDLSAGEQPAATLSVRGGELRLENGAPLIVTGSIEISTHRDVTLPMPDGSEIQLGIGDYVITADAFVDDDKDPAGDVREPGRQPKRIAVEVVRGEPAQVVRVAVGATLVAAGTVGVYQGGSAVVLSGPVGLAANDAHGGDRVPPPADAPVGTVLFGQVVDTQGLPNVGAEVFLAFGSQGNVLNGARVTGADGQFALQSDSPCHTEFVVALALPANIRRDLGVSVPDAYPLRRDGGVLRLAVPMLLQASRPLLGQLSDDQGDIVVGAQIVPCLVDGLFGCVLPLTSQRTVSDASGAFRIDRLPAGLPSHQSLALLVSGEQIAAAALPVPTRGGSAAAEPQAPFVVRRQRFIRVHMLPPSTPVTVLEEVPGLPPGTAAVSRTVTANWQGRIAEIGVGAGRMWLVSGGGHQPMLRELLLDEVVGLPRYRPSLSVQPMPTLFRALQSLPGNAVEVVHSYRHQRFETAPVANAVSAAALRVLDAVGRPVEGAHVFALDPGGVRGRADARFLGFTSPTGVASLGALEAGQHVVVLGPAGTVGYLSDALSHGLTVTLPLAVPGRVVLGPALRPGPVEPYRVVTARLIRTESPLTGLLPELVRFFCEQDGWQVEGVPPGSYRVEINGVARTIEVPAGGSATVQ
jgi:hypothetical protein